MKYRGYYNPEDMKRLEFTASLIPANSTVLDIGAYDSTFKNLLESEGHSVTAIDIEPHGDNVLMTGITSILREFGTDSFDCVTALEILEHLSEHVLHPGVKQMLEVARSTIVISVPNDEFPLSYSHLQSFDREKLRQMFLGNYSGTQYCDFYEIGNSLKYHGLHRWLGEKDKRLLNIMNKIFGMRRKECSSWLIGRFSRC